MNVRVKILLETPALVLFELGQLRIAMEDSHGDHPL